MAEFSKLVITRKGQALLAKMLAGQGNIEFSKISASTAFYEVEQLDALEELPDVKQTNKISKITRTNDVAVKVETAFSNTELTKGYYMRTLGLYAIDPDEGEILYAATTETTGNCYMPAYNGVTVSGVYVQLVTTVGNAENVSIKIDQAAIATIGNIQDLQAQIDMILGKSPDGSGLQFAEGLDAENVVDAINKVFQSGNEAKDKLVENLIAMGISASTDETLGQLIDKVLEMTDTSEDTVTAAVMLEGYTAHNAAGEQITGIIPERVGVTVDATVTTQDDAYTYFGVPEGYYDENSKVRSQNGNLSGNYKVFTVNNGTDMRELLPNDYQKLTIDNFFVLPPASGSDSGRIGNMEGSQNNPMLYVNFNRGTFSYDASTGIFTFTNGSAQANYDNRATKNATVKYSKVICVYPVV